MLDDDVLIFKHRENLLAVVMIAQSKFGIQTLVLVFLASKVTIQAGYLMYWLAERGS
jgi:hypothetical protein